MLSAGASERAKRGESKQTQDLTYIMFDSNRSGNFEIYEAHAVF